MSFFNLNQIKTRVTCTYPSQCNYWDEQLEKCTIPEDKQCPLDEEENEGKK